jgi:hypothetical protein
MPQVPGTVYIDIDPADLPAGPTGEQGPAGQDGVDGSGIVRQVVNQVFAPGTTTTSTSFTGSGHSVSLTPLTPSRVVVRVSGMVGHTDAGSLVHFSLKKNGTLITLPSGISGLTAVKVIDSAYAHQFGFEFEESPNTDQQVTYELAWRVHAGTAYLGKRPSDTTINVQTRISATELIS